MKLASSLGVPMPDSLPNPVQPTSGLPETPPCDSRSTAGPGLLAYYLTSLVAVIGVVFGHEFLELPNDGVARRSDLLRSFANWDGAWYLKIQHAGYHYHSRQASDVAFFPAYPLAAGIVARATGWRIDLALLIVSHFCLRSEERRVGKEVTLSLA